MTTTIRPIIIVDGFNNFYRYYMADTSITNSGMLIGGVTGFLKFINRITEDFMPEKLYICWEIGGSSSRRTKIFEGYKANRNQDKNTFKQLKSETSFNKWAKTEQDNKTQQLSILINALKNIPVCQLYIQGIEGDDLMSYLIRYKLKSLPNKKIIISSDKDFYQLLDDSSVEIYNPMKKSIITKEKVIEEYGISANNFALAKSLVGDTSDNINGIEGLGFKTIAKRFPELNNSNKDYLVSEIIELANQKSIAEPKIKIFNSIKENKDLIMRNWKLIQLDSTVLSTEQIKKLEYSIDNFVPKMDKLTMIKGLISHGIVSDIDYDRFSSNMKRILL